MINNVIGSGAHITVSSTYSSTPYVANNGNPGQGVVRCLNGNMEVWDGSMWLLIPMSSATITMSGVADSAISWVIAKMVLEQERERLAKEHPAVANAINAVKKAEEQLDLVVKLSKEHGEQLESS